ncbi:hypothetical protein C8A00DRAFT_37581 [Chaetomidium leptoderma]|uniref:Uncharacterized protein n=1 Tax=Chaetomidium leptoderma TaxID=669021 RepID=A0AAN6VFZ0_9PEZI|nr:hypothetical protein C8A00DRAFT_37581 [Chaetomidium leptoderma]
MRLRASLGVLAGVAWLASSAAVPRLDDAVESTCSSTAAEKTTTMVASTSSCSSTILEQTTTTAVNSARSSTTTVITLTVTPDTSYSSSPTFSVLPSSVSGSSSSVALSSSPHGSQSSSCTASETAHSVPPSTARISIPGTVTITKFTGVSTSTASVQVVTVTLSAPNSTATESVATVSISETTSVILPDTAVTAPPNPVTSVTVTIPKPIESDSTSVLTLTFPDGFGHTATVVVTVTIPEISVTSSPWSTIITPPTTASRSVGKDVTVTVYSTSTSTVSVYPPCSPPSSGASGNSKSWPAESITTVTVRRSSTTPSTDAGPQASSLYRPYALTYTLLREPGRQTPFTGTITITPSSPAPATTTVTQVAPVVQGSPMVTVLTPSPIGPSLVSIPLIPLTITIWPKSSATAVTESTVTSWATPSSPIGSASVSSVDLTESIKLVTYTVPGHSGIGASSYTVTYTLGPETATTTLGYGSGLTTSPVDVTPIQTSDMQTGETGALNSSSTVSSNSRAPFTLTVTPTDASGTPITITYTPGQPRVSKTITFAATTDIASTGSVFPTSQASGYGTVSSSSPGISTAESLAVTLSTNTDLPTDSGGYQVGTTGGPLPTDSPSNPTIVTVTEQVPSFSPLTSVSTLVVSVITLSQAIPIGYGSSTIVDFTTEVTVVAHWHDDRGYSIASDRYDTVVEYLNVFVDVPIRCGTPADFNIGRSGTFASHNMHLDRQLGDDPYHVKFVHNRRRFCHGVRSHHCDSIGIRGHDLAFTGSQQFLLNPAKQLSIIHRIRDLECHHHVTVFGNHPVAGGSQYHRERNISGVEISSGSAPPPQTEFHHHGHATTEDSIVIPRSTLGGYVFSQPVGSYGNPSSGYGNPAQTITSVLSADPVSPPDTELPVSQTTPASSTPLAYGAPIILTSGSVDAITTSTSSGSTVIQANATAVTSPDIESTTSSAAPFDLDDGVVLYRCGSPHYVPRQPILAVDELHKHDSVEQSNCTPERDTPCGHIIHRRQCHEYNDSVYYRTVCELKFQRNGSDIPARCPVFDLFVSNRPTVS